MSTVLPVALYTNYVAYVLLILCLFIFPTSYDRLRLPRIGKFKNKDPISTSWCFPRWIMLLTRFIAAFICLTLLFASFLDEDWTYFRWYSFFNHVLLTLFFVLAWFWTCIDCCEPELLAIKPRFLYMRRIIWMLFSTQCATTAVSTAGVWVFAYWSSITLKRVKILGIRWVALHTLNCILIAFEILFNSIPLLVYGVLWSLTIALLYVASTWIYPAREDGVDHDWCLYFVANEKSAILWFNIFLGSHLVAYLIAFCVCRIKFYLFLRSSWLLLTDDPAMDKPSTKSSSSKAETKRCSASDELDCEYSAEITKDREEYLHHTSWCSVTTPPSHTTDTPPLCASSISKKRKWSLKKSLLGESIFAKSTSSYSSCNQSFGECMHPGGPGNLHNSDL